MSDPQTVTIIGLGSMGFGAATALLRAGFRVKGVDLRSDVLQEFTARGGDAYATAKQAGASDIVFVFVVNAAQAKQVLFGGDGALSQARQGTVFVLCVTMEPSHCIEIAAELEASGMLVIDAPVSGGKQKAATGELTVMGSGSQQAFDKSALALEAIAAKVFHLDDKPGTGSKVKMINQLLAGVHIAATAEALTLSARLGLDLGTVFDVIRVSAGASWMFENRGPHIVEGDYAARSAVNIFVKDMGIVAREAAALGASTPLSETALSLFREASEAGLGLEDDAAVAKILAHKSGVLLPGMGA